jgi:phenylalanyl-tRNA synthetase beta chain
VYLATVGDDLPDQPQHLGLAVTGTMTKGGWQVGQELQQWDFYALKGVVERVLAALARSAGEYAAAVHPVLSPGRAAQVSLNGQIVGHLGEVCHTVRDAYDLPTPVFVAELDLELLRKCGAGEAQYRPVSRFPAVTRDVAFLLPRDVAAERAESVIRSASGEELETLFLFDVFEGEPLPKGKRNLAFSLSFRRSEGTLTDEEVDAAMERVREALREQLGAQIRE